MASEEAWSAWSIVSENTREGEVVGDGVESWMYRSMRNNKHVESGPPEFATPAKTR